MVLFWLKSFDYEEISILCISTSVMLLVLYYTNINIIRERKSLAKKRNINDDNDKQMLIFIIYTLSYEEPAIKKKDYDKSQKSTIKYSWINYILIRQLSKSAQRQNTFGFKLNSSLSCFSGASIILKFYVKYTSFNMSWHFILEGIDTFYFITWQT